jgi:hypothetical protein
MIDPSSLGAALAGQPAVGSQVNPALQQRDMSSLAGHILRSIAPHSPAPMASGIAPPYQQLGSILSQLSGVYGGVPAAPSLPSPQNVPWQSALGYALASLLSPRTAPAAAAGYESEYNRLQDEYKQRYQAALDRWQAEVQARQLRGQGLVEQARILESIPPDVRNVVGPFPVRAKGESDDAFNQRAADWYLRAAGKLQQLGYPPEVVQQYVSMAASHRQMVDELGRQARVEFEKQRLDLAREHLEYLKSKANRDELLKAQALANTAEFRQATLEGRALDREEREAVALAGLKLSADKANAANVLHAGLANLSAYYSTARSAMADQLRAAESGVYFQPPAAVSGGPPQVSVPQVAEPTINIVVPGAGAEPAGSSQTSAGAQSAPASREVPGQPVGQGVPASEMPRYVDSLLKKAQAAKAAGIDKAQFVTSVMASVSWKQLSDAQQKALMKVIDRVYGASQSGSRSQALDLSTIVSPAAMSRAIQESPP